jgi:hypothetical protein
MMDASIATLSSPSGKGYTDKLSLQELKQLCPIPSEEQGRRLGIATSGARVCRA